MNTQLANEVLSLKDKLEKAEKEPSRIEGQLERIYTELKSLGIDPDNIEEDIEKIKLQRKVFQENYDLLLREYNQILKENNYDG